MRWRTFRLMSTTESPFWSGAEIARFYFRCGFGICHRHGATILHNASRQVRLRLCPWQTLLNNVKHLSNYLHLFGVIGILHLVLMWCDCRTAHPGGQSLSKLAEVSKNHTARNRVGDRFAKNLSLGNWKNWNSKEKDHAKRWWYLIRGQYLKRMPHRFSSVLPNCLSQFCCGNMLSLKQAKHGQAVMIARYVQPDCQPNDAPMISSCAFLTAAFFEVSTTWWLGFLWISWLWSPSTFLASLGMQIISRTAVPRRFHHRHENLALVQVFRVKRTQHV